MKKSILVLGSIGLLFMCACGPEQKDNQTAKQELIQEKTPQKVDQFEETFYQIPAPEELFAFVKDGKLTYDPTLLNPIENSGKYVDVKSKEVNFGIYIADLAYAAAFHEYQESLDNIETVRDLSEEIGISTVFDEELTKRIRNIFENPDSLLNITNSSYYKIITYLEENERGKTLALISAGGWLESLYIFTNLVPKYSSDNTTIQRIADQKYTFENLIEYLKKHQNDPNVKQIISDLAPIIDIFKQLQIVEQQQTTKKPEGENVIVVGGSKKIQITEEQFNTLKAALTQVRNKLSLNS